MKKRELKSISNCNKTAMALEKTSKILNSNFEPDETFKLILTELNDLYNYDTGCIYFLDGDGFKLKSVYPEQNRSIMPDTSEILEFSQDFIDKKSIIISSTDNSTPSLLKELGFDIFGHCSYIVAPMVLRSTLFGMILLLKNEKDYFSEEDRLILNSFSSVASYAVKDAELGNVFKLQLKALRENIVEKNEAYIKIKAQNEKILEADRVKNEFLANMSHELRTPLNAIIGFSEALSLKLFGDLTPKQEEYVHDIHSSGIHLLGMINDLLDIAKIEANEMKLCKEYFNITQVTKESVNIVTPLANKKNISIKVISEDENLEIYADQQKYQQIMYNLLSNSIKFTDDNGFVEVKIEASENVARVHVKDNGIGIDPKYHGKIFAKFQQVDSSYTRKQSSTGLGLTITKELIELHGGKIWIESKLNEGTTFTFELPVNER